MVSLLKTLVGVLIVVVVGSYIIDSRPVSNVRDAGPNDPLVTGARVVKQEVRTITDPVRIESYKQAVKAGLNKAANKLQELTAENTPVQQPPEQGPKVNSDSL